MPKTKTTTRVRGVKTIAEAKAILDQIRQAPPLPSHRAMDLAKSFMDRTRKGKGTDDIRQIGIAEMIDSALRIDHAVGESNGVHKGIEDATQAHENAVIAGFIDENRHMAELKANGRIVVILPGYVAGIIAKHLRRGRGVPSHQEMPAGEPRQWQVGTTLRFTDEDLHASLKQRA